MALGRNIHWQPTRSVAARQLVDECSAFIVGNLAELYQGRDGYAPLWSWTNALAHGDENTLRHLYMSNEDKQDTLAGQQWRSARSYLAGEVLTLAHRDGSLRQVQQAVLIPIELQLATEDPNDTRWPARWVSTVVTALDQYRRVRQH